MKWYTGAIAGLFFVAVGCSHLSPTKNVLTPDYLIGKESRQITFFGDNDHPRFSFNSTKLLYQGTRPSLHKGSQLYEMDLLKNKERRVTFSDGDAFDGTYIGDSEILYASTTDEIKENIRLAAHHDKIFPPSDLYMSDLYGNDILRLTRQPGFDGTPLFLGHQEKPFILFSSRRGELSGIYRLDLAGLPVSLISAEKGKEKLYPTLIAGGQKVAWVETDLATKKQKLILYHLKQKTSMTLKKEDGTYRDLFLAPRPPERLFYSILRNGEKQYQIEVYNIEKNCTQVVFKGSDSLLSPAVSDEAPERLAFTRVFQDKKQIYMVQLPTDLGPCLETPAQATLKE